MRLGRMLFTASCLLLCAWDRRAELPVRAKVKCWVRRVWCEIWLMLGSFLHMSSV